MEYTENKSSKKLIIFEITCVLIIIALIGYTYSYFNVSVTNDTTISGRVASLSLTLNVSRVAPSNTNGLIPQLDQYITSAVIGRNGSCIDDNNNNVCQVYQIKVKNTSSVSLYANGTVTLDNKNNPNLKWAQISGTTSPTLVSSVNTPSTVTLVEDELFTANEEKIYYIVVWISETGEAQYDTGSFTGVVTFGDASNTEPVGEPFLALSNITVDGSPATTFPTGAYTVNTNCTTATASFDYENWRLRVSSLSTDGVADCSPTFTSKEKVYLNNKVISLAGQTSGTGEVVKEEPSYTDVDYSQAVKLTESEYGTPTTFSSSSYSSTSGTEVSNAFTFSDNSWSSVPANLTTNRYYHFKFNVPSDGYYRLCYTMSTGSTSNRLYLYKNTTRIEFGTSSYMSASSSSEKSGCQEIGALTTSDYVKVSQRAYRTIATLNFYLEKTTVTNTYTLQAGYRYEGKNPNNYIKFNNEMWRIIGVFDATSHGQTGLNLTKIIRNDSIGGYAWDSNEVNIWPNSSLYNLLNTYYYNSDNGQDSGYCYQYSTTITGHCDYTNTGIQDYYRPMVKNVTWYLGGYSSTSATADNFFSYERSTSDDNYYSANTGYKTTTGYIGLMYPSDYGYSVLSSSCDRTTNLGSYNTAACGGSSWLKKETYEWTLSHYASNSYAVFTVYNTGNLLNDGANGGFGTRPTLYLDSSVYIVNGTGTESDPYIIAMDS